MNKLRSWNSIFMLSILIIATFLSCKKDNYENNNLNKINVKDITYGDFLKEININSIGFLKQQLINKGPKVRLMTLYGSNEYGNLAVYTDQVRKIINDRDTSYIFKMALTSQKSVSFRNLSINKKNGKTTAFIATYTPTNEWISALKSNKTVDYKGEVSFTELNLNASNLNEALSVKQKLNDKKIMSLSASKNMLKQRICFTYTIITSIPYGCSQGNHMPWDDSCAWNTGTSVPSGENAAGYISSISYSQVCEDITIPENGGGSGGGGGVTTPIPPGTYDPCNGNTPRPPEVVFNKGTRLMVVAPTPCDGGGIGGGTQPITPVFDEFSPIYLPDDFDVIYPQEWYDNEDELGVIGLELLQQGIPNTDPIPESYYKNGTGIDMTNASPVKSRTVTGVPRSPKYFWDELIKKRPEMFSEENRLFIATNKFEKVNVDDQWIRYNPTHKAFKFNQLVHHHHQQGKMAFAIPAKVHQKWTRILHQIRANGKTLRLGNRLNSLAGFMQIFSILTDIKTGNPDAWVNGFGATNEMGKLYKEQLQNFYFEITAQTIYKNISGTVTRAIVTYDAFEDYIWDEDEKRYMGVLKIATYVEDIDAINHRTNSLVRK